MCPGDASNSGSVGARWRREFRIFGIGSPGEGPLSRLRESLEIIKALWAGEALDYEGEHFTLHGGQQRPGPVGRSRSSSAGRVRERCAWWPPMPTGGTCTPTSSTSSTRCARSRGTARCSLQVQVAFVPPGGPRDEIEATARRRFGSIRSSAAQPSWSTTSARCRSAGRAGLCVVLRLRPTRDVGGLRGAVIGQFGGSTTPFPCSQTEIPRYRPAHAGLYRQAGLLSAVTPKGV